MKFKEVILKMEDIEAVEQNDQEKPESSSKTPVVLAVMLLLAAVVMYVLFKNKDKEPAVALSSPEPILATEDLEETLPGEVPVSNTVDVAMGMYFFEPNEIRVKAGEPVIINLINNEGMHDFVIDVLRVKSKTLKAGDTQTLTFTVDKPGEYEYYCSINNHKEMGMVGKLIVE